MLFFARICCGISLCPGGSMEIPPHFLPQLFLTYDIILFHFIQSFSTNLISSTSFLLITTTSFSPLKRTVLPSLFMKPTSGTRRLYPYSEAYLTNFFHTSSISLFFIFFIILFYDSPSCSRAKLRYKVRKEGSESLHNDWLFFRRCKILSFR